MSRSPTGAENEAETASMTGWPTGGLHGHLQGPKMRECLCDSLASYHATKSNIGAGDYGVVVWRVGCRIIHDYM